MLKEYREKILALIFSRRFQAAVLAIIVMLLTDVAGIPIENAEWIAGVIVAWILGDSINKTTIVRN